MEAGMPENENERLQALQRYNILDTLEEQAYDDITLIASYIANSPIALISLIDGDRQWFKSKIGLAVSETPREFAFCAHSILRPSEPLIVPDVTQDRRFADNPLVTGDPDIRFYLGAPLVTPDQYALGTLCVIDREPRVPSTEQIKAISALSRQVVAQLELGRTIAELQRVGTERDRYLAQLEGYQQELEAANRQLHQASITDKLTGVGNRGAFDQRLAEELYRSSRYNTPMSLLLIDVDGFKQYNDSFGHPTADNVLQKIAKLMQRSLRPSDFIARYGGDEFAVILANTGRDGAALLAERIRRKVSDFTFPHRPVTLSIGASTSGQGTSDSNQLLEAADAALYAAKQAGRNRAVHAEYATA